LIELDWETAYRLYAASVYAYIRGMTGSAKDAEDILHDVFLLFSERLDKLQPDTNIHAYLLASARNRIFNANRSRAREKQRLKDYRIFSGWRKQEESDTVDAIEKERLLESVHRALGSLSEEARELVLLRTQAGLSLREIAEMFSVPLTTVSSRYQKALALMREMMKNG
jgi:RNA polymerase sigma-70 factor (ECF subfamily)